MNDGKTKIIFSDFDGTVTKKDTYIRSLFFYSSCIKILLNIPGLVFNLIKYIFGMKTRNEMKEYSYKKFYSGVSVAYINKKSKKYLKSVKFNHKVLDLLNKFRDDGYKIVLVTASPDIYMNYFAKELGYDGLICTLTEKSDDRLTGKLSGMNCNNEEKVKRIRESEYYDASSRIITFGNSKGDHPMLGISDEYYYVIKGNPVKNAKLN
ncbi:MAG: HAD-IB family phosphatase [Candidatus Delongbacteria bacterium]|nr:HAD-IB family phosphatase [Candidatus Delongbacteria bacterium]